MLCISLPFFSFLFPCFFLLFGLSTVGFPPGVINVILGHGLAVGRPLCIHDQVDKVIFIFSLLFWVVVVEEEEGCHIHVCFSS